MVGANFCQLEFCLGNARPESSAIIMLSDADPLDRCGKSSTSRAGEMPKTWTVVELRALSDHFGARFRLTDIWAVPGHPLRSTCDGQTREPRA